jgi:hypothetical protein
MPSRTADSLQTAYAQTHHFFRAHGHHTQFQVLDNECPTQLRTYFSNNNIKWQLVTPYKKRTNKAERAIQTFKRHFLSILATTNPSFPLDYWPELHPKPKQRSICSALGRMPPPFPRITAFGVSRTTSQPTPWLHWAPSSSAITRAARRGITSARLDTT